MSQFFASSGQRTGVSASASVLPVNIQDWFPSELTGWISLESKGILHFIVCCFIYMQGHFTDIVYYYLKVYGKPLLNKPINAIFPTAFCTLGHIVCNSLNISSFYHYICYGDLWSVISDVTIVIVLGAPQTMSIWGWKLNEHCGVLTVPQTSHPPTSLPLFGLPYSLRHKSIELRPVNNHPMASKCSKMLELHVSHFKWEVRDDQASWWRHVGSQGRPKARPLVPNS